MRKYLLHVLIISFVFLLAPAAQVATYAGELEDAKEKVRKYPDDALAHFFLGLDLPPLFVPPLKLEFVFIQIVGV